MSVLSPRRANAAARFTAVVVLPTPPFWLTIARTSPTLRLELRHRAAAIHGAAAQRVERLAPVAHPAVGLGARRRLGEEGFQVSLGLLQLPALDQQEREAVVGARQRRLHLERAPVALDGV